MHRHVRHVLLPSQSNNHRARILHPEGLAIVAVIVMAVQAMSFVLSSSPGSLPSILGFSSSITVSQVVAETNAKRAAAGLPILTANDKLMQAAQAKGAHMCKEQYWAHIAPSGTTPWLFIRDSGYKYSVAGENLARDFSDTSSMVSAWMASPSHKANIVNPKYKDIGIAVIDCNLLGSDTALVVQMFGTQLSTARTATRPPQDRVAARTQSAVQGLESESNELAMEVEQLAPGQIPITTVAPAVLAQEQLDESEPIAPVVLESTRGPSWFTPLQIQKALYISVLSVLLAVLCLDIYIIQYKNTIRIAGRSLAHVVFLAGIFIIVLVVKAGVIM